MGLVVEVRKPSPPPPRDSIDKCTDRRYKKRNERVQKTVASLGMARNERDQMEEEKMEDEYEPIPEPDAHGELHGEALAQAERAAAARPGVNDRLEDAIERFIARGRVRAGPESREEHFEGEPAGNGLVWRRINGRWATGVQ